MHDEETWPSNRAHFGWVMLVFCSPKLSLSLTETHAIIFENGNKRPQTCEELFNLWHAQLRNVIERCFNALKRRFKILKSTLEYPIWAQAKIPASLVAVQNYIHLNDLDDPIYQRYSMDPTRYLQDDTCISSREYTWWTETR